MHAEEAHGMQKKLQNIRKCVKEDQTDRYSCELMLSSFRTF